MWTVEGRSLRVGERALPSNKVGARCEQLFAAIGAAGQTCAKGAFIVIIAWIPFEPNLLTTCHLPGRASQGWSCMRRMPRGRSNSNHYGLLQGLE